LRPGHDGSGGIGRGRGGRGGGGGIRVVGIGVVGRVSGIGVGDAARRRFGGGIGRRIGSGIGGRRFETSFGNSGMSSGCCACRWRAITLSHKPRSVQNTTQAAH